MFLILTRRHAISYQPPSTEYYRSDVTSNDDGKAHGLQQDGQFPQNMGPYASVPNYNPQIHYDSNYPEHSQRSYNGNSHAEIW